MDASSSIRAWARRLVITEAAGRAESGSRQSPATLVPETLRLYLTRLVGPDGFAALQRRALALARSEIPSLQAVTVTADGALQGIEELRDDGEAATAITAQMLTLLFTLVGKTLTLRLMLDAFPDVPYPIIAESEDLS